MLFLVLEALGALQNMLESHDRMIQMQSNYKTNNNFQAYVGTDGNFLASVNAVSF